MRYRRLGKTGYQVSEIGFGAWSIGGSWGEQNDEQSLEALRAGLASGINFIDTADVYGDGRSERLIGRVVQESGPRSLTSGSIVSRASSNFMRSSLECPESTERSAPVSGRHEDRELRLRAGLHDLPV